MGRVVGLQIKGKKASKKPTAPQKEQKNPKEEKADGKKPE